MVLFSRGRSLLKELLQNWLKSQRIQFRQEVQNQDAFGCLGQHRASSLINFWINPLWSNRFTTWRCIMCPIRIPSVKRQTVSSAGTVRNASVVLCLTYRKCFHAEKLNISRGGNAPRLTTAGYYCIYSRGEIVFKLSHTWPLCYLLCSWAITLSTASSDLKTLDRTAFENRKAPCWVIFTSSPTQESQVSTCE